jgi:hypothetical protein
MSVLALFVFVSLEKSIYILNALIEEDKGDSYGA